MKERPILYSGPMVRALLQGRKTQTRRAVMPQPLNIVPFIGCDNMLTGTFGICTSHHGVISKHMQCPYGQPGDSLWVRETWALAGLFNSTKPSALSKEWSEHQIEEGLLWYRADGEQPSGKTVSDRINGRGRWRPSIHMPRWASRITLEIVSVRVERLRDISEEDAKAEGVEPNCMLLDHSGCDHDEWIHYGRHEDDFPAFTAKESFQSLWESINGPDSWKQNPWVWVIEFKVIKGLE